MKIAWLLGIACAVLFHAAVLLFGGIFFMDKKENAGTLQTVDLLSDVDAEKPKDKKPEEPKEAPKEEIEPETEQPPDAAEIMRSLDVSPIDNAPALEAASLSAIEAALNGAAGASDFSQALGFESGGRIGGHGLAGGESKQLEEAFNPSDIDQAPRAIFQESPHQPNEMRGKNVEGVVSLFFVVDANGKVENPRVEKSSHQAFEAPALAAIKKWKFEPGLKAGQRVASKAHITIRFPPN